MQVEHATNGLRMGTVVTGMALRVALVANRIPINVFPGSPTPLHRDIHIYVRVRMRKACARASTHVYGEICQQIDLCMYIHPTMQLRLSVSRYVTFSRAAPKTLEGIVVFTPGDAYKNQKGLPFCSRYLLTELPPTKETHQDSLTCGLAECRDSKPAIPSFPAPSLASVAQGAKEKTCVITDTTPLGG